MGFCTSQIPWTFNWKYRHSWVKSVLWPIIAHLSKQTHNTSPLFSVVVGVGVGSSGNGAVDASVLIFSVVVRVGVGYAGNGSIDASAVIYQRIQCNNHP